MLRSLSTTILTISLLSTPAVAQLVAVPQTELKASDADAFDRFGGAVALSGDTLVVGARADDGNTGAAYVFVRSGTDWTEQAKLVASDGQTGLQFGSSVAIDGETILVGMPGTGFGTGVGAAYVFVRSGTAWGPETKLLPGMGIVPAAFGFSVALRGDDAVVGARDAVLGGSAYVFVRSGANWSEQSNLRAMGGQDGDRFGASVAIAGDTIAVGAEEDDLTGAAYVFTRSGTMWTEAARLDGCDAGNLDDFGFSIAIEAETILVGAPKHNLPFMGDAGAVYVFVGSGASWTQQAKLTARSGSPGDQLGGSISLDGERAVAGARTSPSNGAAFAFERTGTSWREISKFLRPGGFADRFGSGVAIRGDTLIAGAEASEIDANDMQSGSVHVFAIEELPTFCFGDGGDQTGCTDCPCGNNAAIGTTGGCLNENGTSATLLGSGMPCILASLLRFEMSSGAPSTFAILTSAAARAPANAASPCFGLDSGVNANQFNGLRCVVQSVLRHGSRATDANGDVGLTTNGWGYPLTGSNSIAGQAGFVAGETRHFQAVYRENAHGSCAQQQNTTQGVSVEFCP